MLTLAAILLAAFAVDRVLGDPPYRCHPVRLMGDLASGLETLLRRVGLSGLAGGLILAILHPVLVVAIYLALRALLPALHPAAPYLLDVYAFYSCFAFRDLFQHVTPIADALEADDLPAARRLTQRIVGRDTRDLDPPALARAAVESMAENLGDGALGPLFAFVAGGAVAAGGLGLPAAESAAWATAGALLYRAVNTLDSMVGYRNERYLLFGRASARFDDLASFLPSRLSVAALALAAVLLRRDVRGGLRAWWRDRRRHPSPNAGHPESFVAGALGVRLGGPTVYPHGRLEKAWLGDGRAELDAGDVRSGCRLVRWAGTLAMVAAAAGLALS